MTILAIFLGIALLWILVITNFIQEDRAQQKAYEARKKQPWNWD